MKREEIFEKFKQLGESVQSLGCIAQNDWTDFLLKEEFINEWEANLRQNLEEIDNLRLITKEAIENHVPREYITIEQARNMESELHKLRYDPSKQLDLVHRVLGKYAPLEKLDAGEAMEVWSYVKKVRAI